jgi:small subunit ribosomal protein S3
VGQKINPTGFRIGNYLSWKSRWYSNKTDFKTLLIEDIAIRNALFNKLKLAGLVDVVIERLPKSVNIILYVSRPGVVIGRGGSGIEEIRKFVIAKLVALQGKKNDDVKVDISVNEIKNPDLSARLVTERMISELERRMPHGRVVTRAMERVMASGARGIKVCFSGRIAGAEIGRREKYHMGSVPTQTLREDIDYYEHPALLKRGYMGVKVWIHRPEEK